MIDADLYQMLTLGLLGLILLVSLLTYSAVASLRRSGGVAPAETGISTQTAGAVSSPDYGVAAQPSPVATAAPAAADMTPAAAQPAAAQPIATAAQPVAAAAAVQPAAGEPQDQPFERDGRWWFRRGNELLVYDERTGQWVAAEGAAAPAATAAAAPVGTAAVAGEAGGAFWKCPSCGAVNGATATTCRMCFTARP
ncbi:MAG TPA: Ran-binding zinc finger domain-containing protein [Actinomycetota bacterium]|nr:Ran-binding zinc finger domain-containing protein [Actinomycetota bacterium]